MRTGGCLLLALALAACDFPEVPRGAAAGVEAGGRFVQVEAPAPPPAEPYAEEEAGAPLERRRPAEVEGLLVSNAVSSLVIERPDGSHVTLQVAPQTELRIGDVRAGLREIQPGTDVRARYVPLGDRRFDVALEVEAAPGTVGWRHRRSEGAPAD